VPDNRSCYHVGQAEQLGGENKFTMVTPYRRKDMTGRVSAVVASAIAAAAMWLLPYGVADAADVTVIVGHVPAQDTERLLVERPEARALAAPGMPLGSPGMEGDVGERYNVLLFRSDGTAAVYARN
jgi:hypothetical protein